MECIVNVFKPVSYNKDYMVSTEGDIFNIKRSKFLNSNTKPYKTTTLRGKPTKGIHVLVAEEFIKKPKCSKVLVVNHLDCDTQNNHVLNLEWTTYSGNTKHAISNGRMKVHGEDNPLSILSSSQVSSICGELSRGTGTTDVSRMFKIGVTTIQQIKSGVNWTHISRDFNLSVRKKSKICGVGTVRDICEKIQDGKVMKLIAKETGISLSVIKKIKQRKNHTKISSDYKW